MSLKMTYKLSNTGTGTTKHRNRRGQTDAYSWIDCSCVHYNQDLLFNSVETLRLVNALGDFGRGVGEGREGWRA